MKKIIFMLLLSSFMVGNCLAMDLETAITGSLSSGVIGLYNANESAAGGIDATSFLISTGHTQGTVSYATGSFSSDMYVVDNAASDLKFASSDLLDSTTFTSATLTNWGAVK